MNEVKKPKKPLMFYYGIVMLIIILFNFFAVPWIAGQQVKEVDYGTFMSMIEEKNIGLVEISELENQIVLPIKKKNIFIKLLWWKTPPGHSGCTKQVLSFQANLWKSLIGC